MDMTESIIKLEDAITSENGNNLPPRVKEELKSMKVEAFYWEKAFSQKTPTDMVYEREGPGGDLMEYVKDSYSIRELNRLYPGWYQEDMKVEYIPQVATFVVSGYAIITYPTLTGIKRRKIWALGSATVQMKKDADTVMPSQPDDVAKAAYTEWIKLVAKRLGIGVDIYEQSITDEMIQEFEDKVKDWDRRNIVDAVAKSIKSKKAFTRYVNNLPSKKQTEEFKETIKSFDNNIQIQLWEQFQKHQVSTAGRYIKQIKDKLQQRGEQHGKS